LSSQTILPPEARQGNIPLYEKFFLHDLRLSPDFLTQHRNLIRERLKRAADEFARDHGNIFAINMCLHAASSIILSNPEYLKTTLQAVKETRGLEAGDPTTVLTVGALYYLIKWDANMAASERQTADSPSKSNEAVMQADRLKMLQQGLDKINWLIGEDAMTVLGLKKLD